jgi:hypothetical protein
MNEDCNETAYNTCTIKWLKHLEMLNNDSITYLIQKVTFLPYNNNVQRNICGHCRSAGPLQTSTKRCD